MQGPSELGASGILANWDRTDDLESINVPTLVIGATHDTMDPVHMEMVAGRIPHGRFLLCRNGSHMCMYDDQVDVLPRTDRLHHRHRSLERVHARALTRTTGHRRS